MRKFLASVMLLTLSLFAEPHLEFSEEFNASTESNATDMVFGDGGLYVVGTVDRSQLQAPTGTPPTTPMSEGFLAKFEREGNLTLFQTIGDGTIAMDTPTAVTTHGDFIYMTGYTDGDINGSRGALGTTDIFVAKFDQTGHLHWVNQIGTPDNDSAHDIITDDFGDVYVVGTEENISGPVRNQVLYKFSSHGFELFKHIYQDSANWDDKIKIKFDFMKDSLYIVRSSDNSLDPAMRLRIEVINRDGEVLNDRALATGNFDSLIDFDFVTREDNSTEFFSLMNSGAMTNIQKSVLEANGSFSEFTEDPVGGFPDTMYQGSVYGYATAVQYHWESDALFVTTGGSGMPISIQKVNTSDLMSSFELLTFGSADTGVANSLAVDDSGDIFLAGSTSQPLISDYDPAFPAMYDPMAIQNMFFAKVENKLKNLYLSAGWNLVSGNIDRGSLSDKITIVYQYSNHLQNWEAYSPDPDLNNFIVMSRGIPEVMDINNSEGTWILSEVDHSLIMNSNDSDTDTENYLNGWSLNGTGVDLNTSNISCNFGTLASVWKYVDGDWQLNSPNPTAFPSIQRFDTIHENEGFWVDCQ